MKVKDILAEKGSAVRTIGPDETVREAIRQLVEHRIGSLLVTEGKRIVGIITERDILREACHHAGRLDERRVREAMTGDLIVGVPEDEVTYVMGIMTKNRIRHLPILEGRELRGMVSIGDAVWASLTEAEFENRNLKEYITGTY
ncbi:MAG TPA: CBS domain-containing protein [Gemmatimonadota bacterium]|jgi:CBS domain-containing protein